jgi:hypothetical protein
MMVELEAGLVRFALQLVEVRFEIRDPILGIEAHGDRQVWTWGWLAHQRLH